MNLESSSVHDERNNSEPLASAPGALSLSSKAQGLADNTEHSFDVSPREEYVLLVYIVDGARITVSGYNEREICDHDRFTICK